MNKHDQKNLSPLDKFDLSEEISDHPFILWMSEHKQIVLYVFLGLVALIVLSYRFMAAETSHAENAYLKAQVDFVRFQDISLAATEPQVRQEAFTNLQTIMKKYPELHAKYDGMIAETLIIEAKPDEAEKFAELAFERTSSEDSPFYTEFAKISLLITKESYGEAFQQSSALKEKMLMQMPSAQNNNIPLSFGPTLFALNLIRIAMLQQQLGNAEGEIQAWNELKAFVKSENGKSNTFDSSQFQPVMALFNEGKTNLEKYMVNRLNALQAF